MENWIHEKAAAYYPIAIKLFGKPVFAANVPYGMVFWKSAYRDLFESHCLKDEQVEHCVPKPHIDFFYSSIKFYVPPEKLLDVLKISGSVQYDGLKKILTARCAGINANIATLYLAMQVAMDNMSIVKIKKKKLYGKYIRGEVASHSDLAEEMKILKWENHKIYKKELKEPFYKLAFNSC